MSPLMHTMLRGDFLSLVRTDIPMTSRLCEKIIQTLAETYPFMEAEKLTETDWGRGIWALTVGEGERHVIYSAAHHANEWITAVLLLKFAEDVAQAYETDGEIYGIKAKQLLKETVIHLVPMVNPDGVDLVTGAIAPGTAEYEKARRIAEAFPQIPFPQGWKANLNGVDLNLQYPAGWMIARELKFSQGFDRPAPRDYVGRAPLDQKESRALAAYTEDMDPDLVIAWHTQGEVIFWQFRDYQVTGAKLLGEEFARLSGYSLADAPYESSFAGYKDWFIQNYRHPGYTVEAGTGENPLPAEQFPGIYRDCLPILVTGAAGLAEQTGI